ncbi:uncharacterized protein EI90DRAFT_3030054, partial [Cantharellus anzutake]|uniref:uncharacterized protein n=1 Tax=Cantharellus anzutake TaxID=1750568 RepID=UPI0019055CDE
MFNSITTSFFKTLGKRSGDASAESRSPSSAPGKGLSVSPSAPTVAISDGKASPHWTDTKSTAQLLRMILEEASSSPISPSSSDLCPTLPQSTPSTPRGCSTVYEMGPPSPPISFIKKHMPEDRFEEALAHQQGVKLKQSRVPSIKLVVNPMLVPHYAMPFFGFDDDDETELSDCSEEGWRECTINSEVKSRDNSPTSQPVSGLDKISHATKPRRKRFNGKPSNGRGKRSKFA